MEFINGTQNYEDLRQEQALVSSRLESRERGRGREGERERESTSRSPHSANSGSTTFFSTERVRIIVFCAMFPTLLTPTRRTTSQQQPTVLPSTYTHAQAPHVTSHITPEAHSSQCDHEYGRLDIGFPRTRRLSISPPERRSFRTSSKTRQRKKGSSQERSAIAVQNVAIQLESEETRGFRECSLECRAGICEPGRLPRLPARGCLSLKPKLKPQLTAEKSRVRFSRQVVARAKFREQTPTSERHPDWRKKKRKESELSTLWSKMYRVD